ATLISHLRPLIYLYRYPNCRPTTTRTKALLFAWFNHHPSAPTLSDISSSAPERESSKSSSPTCRVDVHAPDASPPVLTQGVIFALFGMPDSSGNLRINKRPETSANHARTEFGNGTLCALCDVDSCHLRRCLYTPVPLLLPHHSAPFYQLWYYLSSSSRTRNDCSGDHPRQCCCLARLSYLRLSCAP
ncbi:hypothetical protein F5148DRAFT_1212932, partial [Russula earlei]